MYVFVLYLWLRQEIFLKHFRILRNCFLKVKTILWKLCSFRAAISLGFLFFKNGLNVSVLLFGTFLSWIHTQTRFDLKTHDEFVTIPVCAKK